MPNKRAAGQKLIPIPMKKKFIEKIAEALPELGYNDRSSFIRDAIVEKLQRDGVAIDPALALAPTRLGKGGKQVDYPRHIPNAFMLNEKPNSELNLKKVASEYVDVLEREADQLLKDQAAERAALKRKQKRVSLKRASSEPGGQSRNQSGK